MPRAISIDTPARHFSDIAVEANPPGSEAAADDLHLDEPTVLIRIAGLPWSALDPLRGDQSSDLAEAWNRATEEATLHRTRLVEHIFEHLADYGPEQRRALLKIKRDCHNRRALAKYRQIPDTWSLVEPLAGGAASKIVRLERECDELRQLLAQSISDQRAAEAEYLVSLFEDPRFRRGVALASSTFLQAVRKRSGRPLNFGNRKDRKLGKSMLRFVTRAATKTSPFSTLTPIGIGSVDSRATRPFVLHGPRARNHSYVRSNRWIIERCQEMLLDYEALRNLCDVSLNDTLVRLPEDRFRYLRPARWSSDPKTGKSEFQPSAHVTVTLQGPRVATILSELGESGMPYPDLVTKLAEGEHGADSAGSLLAQLHHIGFLLLQTPWSSSEPRLEQTLLRITGQYGPATVHALLARLLEQQEAFVEADQPDQVLEEISRTQKDLLNACRSVAGLDGRFEETIHTADSGLYEDVCRIDPSRPGGEIATLSGQMIRSLFEYGDLIYRYSYLFSHRHDVMHALCRVWQGRWPDERRIPFLTFFDECLPVWKRYLAFYKEKSTELYSTFDPFDRPEVQALRELRVRIVRDLRGGMMSTADGRSEIDPDYMAASLARIPRRYTPKLGPSFFGQPRDPEAREWVLNRVFEGTGRYLSRFVPALEGAAAERMELQLQATGRGDRAAGAFLDLQFSGSSTSNTRRPFCEHILQSPGECVPETAVPRMQMAGLWIHFDPDEQELSIHDGNGRPLVPVHLSAFNYAYLPVIIRFLALFGPYEVRQVLPRPPATRKEAGIWHPRLRLGPWIVRRQRWELELSSLRKALGTAEFSGPDAFLGLRRWRKANGLPRQVFFYEATDDGSHHKPQFIDFGSPSFTRLFLESAMDQDILILEEVLPDSEACPRAADAEPFAVEAQIDSATLGDFPG